MLCVSDSTSENPHIAHQRHTLTENPQGCGDFGSIDHDCHGDPLELTLTLALEFIRQTSFDHGSSDDEYEGIPGYLGTT